MIITYMTDGAELHLTTFLLRLGFPYGRDVVRAPTQPGDGWGTTTITAALTGEERRAIQLFAATAYGVTIQEESAEDSRPRRRPADTDGRARCDSLHAIAGLRPCTASCRRSERRP